MIYSYGMEDIVDQVLGHLSSPDLRMVRLVCAGWLHLVERITTHREIGRLGWGWSKGEPSLGVMQCTRERSVCTVTTMAVDELSIAAGLGSAGKVILYTFLCSLEQFHCNNAMSSWTYVYPYKSRPS